MVELMVVVAIVSILAVMAAPNYRDMIERNRLRGAADDVLSVLSNARAGAVKAGLDTAVRVTGGASWCVGATSAAVPSGGNAAGVPTACTCSAASTCLVAGEQTAVPVGKHAGVSVASSDATFTYDGKLGTALGSGNAIADPAAIRLTTENYEVRVDVTPLGQATLCTPGSMAGIAAC